MRTPPGVELRPLGRDDLVTAVRLARDLHDRPPHDDPERLRARYEPLINSPDVTAFLALDAGEPVGLGLAHLRRRLNFATFEGWLSELYVRPEARGRGIGRTLVEAVVAEWRLRGGHRLQAQVPTGAEAARATLRRAGFEEGMLDFRLEPVVAAGVEPPEGVRLRQLHSHDGEAVTRLIAEFGPWRSPVPDRMEAVMRTFAAHARATRAGTAASVVAELNGSVIGVCIMEWREPFWDEALHGWIPDLVVTERARGKGIGRALLDHAIAAAAERGASRLTLESGPRRESAHRLYLVAGFEQAGRSYILRREP